MTNKKVTGYLLVAITLLLGAASTFAAPVDSGFTELTKQGGGWLEVAAWLMIGGAGLCFVYASYQAFQREWSSAGVALIVCVMLGLAPMALQWAAVQWGVGAGSSGTLTKSKPMLFMK